MLSGEVPFNDTSAPAILIKHLQEVPLPPSVKNPKVTIPPALEAIALKCLEKSPAARFQTADELCVALDQAAASIPGAAAGMQSQATQPMSAAAVPAATVRLDAAPAPVQTPVAPKVTADTRPTVVPAAHQPPPAVASEGAGTPGVPGVNVAKPSSSKGLLFVAAVVVAMLGVAGYLYMQQQREAQPATAAENQQTAPAASPAMAPAQASSTPATGSSPSADAAAGHIITPAPAAAAPPQRLHRPPHRVQRLRRRPALSARLLRVSPPVQQPASRVLRPRRFRPTPPCSSSARARQRFVLHCEPRWTLSSTKRSFRTCAAPIAPTSL